MNLKDLINILEGLAENYEPYADYEDAYNQGCKDTYKYILSVAKGESK